MINLPPQYPSVRTPSCILQCGRMRHAVSCGGIIITNIKIKQNENKHFTITFCLLCLPSSGAGTRDKAPDNRTGCLVLRYDSPKMNAGGFPEADTEPDKTY